MVSSGNIAAELSALIDSHFEWLIVRESGKTFAVQKPEIEIVCEERKILLGFPGDKGFRAWRVEGFSVEGGEEIELNLAANFARDNEKIRLIPRASALEFSLNIELARLAKANEIAAVIAKTFPGIRLFRVALNAGNGRLAQIILESKSGDRTAALSDVSAILSPETFLTTAILWHAKLRQRRKKPIGEIWMVSERKYARNLQKIRALLNEAAKADLKIFELSPKAAQPQLRELPGLKLSDLWREKPKKLVLPAVIEISETAKAILAVSPEKIDVIFSKQGETLRFLGLPFARVRKILGKEKAWFGIDRERRQLTDRSWCDLLDLVENLENYRRSDSPGKRHELYRLSPESWLEAILRRNIKLLDTNLILSPIYNQFRTSADKIDLLALRKDGRLVIIELKTSPDREILFQAADYWRKIELQRRRGELKNAKVFGDLEILDKPALVYAVAPALSFHRDFEYFAKMLSKEIELWRFELHENWRADLKVIARKSYFA